jgi:hypothetical protein
LPLREREDTVPVVLGSRPRVIAIAMMLVLVTSAFARVAAAGLAWGTFECCCGEHAGDEACGCPDCPAGHQDEHGDESPVDGSPRMKACGPDGMVILPAAFARAIIPVAPAIIVPEPLTLAVEPVAEPRSAPSARPEPPPPRSVASSY